MRQNRLSQTVKYLIFSLVPVTMLILAGELVLRLFFGFPTGMSNFTIIGQYGLYPVNSDFINYMGVVPYRIETNSYGMRGKEISLRKPSKTFRIACLGDSCTDGFYVDNTDNYPSQLESILNSRLTDQPDISFEVINGARGGGSIDKHITKLVDVVAPFKPDVVVVMFVTNDIFDISEIPKIRTNVLDKINSYNGKLRAYTRSPLEVIGEWFLRKSAIGEKILSLKHPNIYTNYRANKNIPLDKERYGYFEDCEKYADNVNLFWKQFGFADGLVLGPVFKQETQILVDNYIYCLDLLNKFCKANKMKLVFTYLPAYSQIYETRSAMKIRDVLKNSCEISDISFIDLTGELRAKGKNKIITFAPFDFHFNPAGNRIIASAIADHLLKQSNLIK